MLAIVKEPVSRHIPPTFELLQEELNGVITEQTATIRVGYEVILEVGIDPVTGTVVDVTAYTEDANESLPVHVYDDDGDYLREDDPRYAWASERALQVEIGSEQGLLPLGRDNVPWTLKASGECTRLSDER